MAIIRHPNISDLLTHFEIEGLKGTAGVAKQQKKREPLRQSSMHFDDSEGMSFTPTSDPKTAQMHIREVHLGCYCKEGG